MCFLLAVSILVLSGCGKKQTQNTDPSLGYQDPYAHLGTDHDIRSDAIYHNALGEFYDIYQTALEAETISQRYALMALAEGKLLQSCIMLPLSASGGTYAIS